MGWFNSVLAANGIRVTEAFLPSIDPDLGYGRDAGGNMPYAYRNLTQSPDRDLQPLDQDEMLKIAAYLYERNPLAQAEIKLLTCFMIGEGLKLTSTNEDLQKILTEFWQDNQLDILQFDLFRQQSIFGELALPAFVRPVDGRVRLGYLDPASIQSVRQNPQNANERIEVHRKQPPGGNWPPFTIIHRDESPGTKYPDRLVGTKKRLPDDAEGIFFFPINGFTNAPRGRSDLMAAFDWLDLYDQALFDQAKRAASLGDVLWDVTMENGTDETMEAWLRKNRIPQGPSLRIHNEKVTWAQQTPNLNAADMSEHARMVRNQILLAHLTPEGWMVAGSETNRSTLSEQSIPAYKYLSQRQKGVRAALQMIGEFVRDQKVMAGKLDNLPNEELPVTVEASEVSTVDLARVALSAKDTSAHLLVAQQNQWLSPQEAARLYRRSVADYGVELDPESPVDALPDGELPPNAFPQNTQSPNGHEPARHGNKQEPISVQQIKEAALAAEIAQTYREMYQRLKPKERAVLTALSARGYTHEP